MKPRSITSMLHKICSKLPDNEKISGHSFRKHFQTSLEAAQVPKNWIALLQGKKISDSTGPYSRPMDLGQLTKKYIEAYDSLRVQEVGEVRELKNRMGLIERTKEEEIERQDTRIAELEADNRELKNQLEGLTTKNEMTILLDEIRKLKEKVALVERVQQGD